MGKRFYCWCRVHFTFYDKESGKYGAIGHPITDSETEKILSIKNGDLLNSSIISIKKGVKGNPGELRGIFSSDKKPIGNVTGNNNNVRII